MNWLHETLGSDLTPEVQAECIEKEYKDIYHDDLTRILDEGYENGFHNPHLVLNALQKEVERVRQELDAGL